MSANQNNLFEEIWSSNLNLKKIIIDAENTQNINYDLKNLLIGCKKQDIQGLFFNLIESNDDTKNEKLDGKEEILRKICDKISKLLPQDIIINLPSNTISYSEFLSLIISTFESFNLFLL